MEETQKEQVDPLTAPVGTKDIPTLGAAKVKILDASLIPKKEGKYHLLSTLCKHPDKEEPVSISKVKFLEGSNVKVSSLWFHPDEDGNVQKGSHVARLLEFTGAGNIRELEQKELMTVHESEDKKYLVFKCYE